MCESCDQWVQEYISSGRAGRWNAKTGKPKRRIETMPFLAMVARMVRAAGKRVADADEVELKALADLHETIDQATQVAVDGMRARGMTWEYIGKGLGVKKSAAQERWGSNA